MSQWRLDWPTSAGARVSRALLKSSPGDFLVDEVLELPGREPGAIGTDPVSGAGEHLCLKLQKTGDNTEFVARELAKMAGSRTFDVGFCGLKDRHAVTHQWFSLYRPGENDQDPELIRAIGARWPVQAACRQARKLRRGDHSGNQFQITLRGVAGSQEMIDQALGRLAEFGAPNYFGPQRFGIAGANLDRAVAMDPAAMNRRAGSGGKRRGRATRGGSEDSKNVLYFSAARSWLFNEVLAARVEDGSWRQEGATGPLWGDGGTTATGLTGALERDVVAR
ncbi:MAG: tRNA pseudouridine(13) synthase TruD, partial [Pseudomonadota bacterium]|nr:tRNA pseudouridine(13) synthase TruD [Pseudomonadota bacterium]